MKRIDTATRAPPLFGAGKDGFKNGNLAAGVAPTDLNADWFNNVQEELLSVIEAAGLAPNGADLAQLRKALVALTPGRLLNIQTFTVSGTYVPTPGTAVITIEMVGGGGSGAGVAATGAGQVSVSTGGGAGSYLRCYVRPAPTTPSAITVGVGGATALGFASNNGGTTSFGSQMTCPGGVGGASAGPAVAPFQIGIPGISGAPVVTIPGATSLAIRGGNANLAYAVGGILVPSAGAASFFGAGGDAPTGGGGTSGAYGAGGGGCAISASTAAQSGGKGGDGVCIIYEYGAS